MLSVASRSIDGYSELDLKRQSQEEIVPNRQYRPRRRRELTLSEQQDIISSYILDYIPQKEIALKYRVTT